MTKPNTVKSAPILAKTPKFIPVLATVCDVLTSVATPPLISVVDPVVGAAATHACCATGKGYDDKIIWDGYGLIDFYPIVHYQSDHPESELVEKELEHVKSMNIKYKNLRDGDVIIVCD